MNPYDEDEPENEEYGDYTEDDEEEPTEDDDDEWSEEDEEESRYWLGED